MEKNRIPVLLALIAIVLITIGNLFLPVVLFLAFSPLLGIYYFNHKFRYKAVDALQLVVLLLSQLSWVYINGLSYLNGFIYSIAIWLAFVTYNFTNKHSKNKLGLFTLLIYWLAIEYLLINIKPDFAFHILGSAFDTINLASWNAHTGLIGVSCWILASNILLSGVFFKGANHIFTGNIRWLSLVYSLIVIALPSLIATLFTFEASTIDAQVTEQLYLGVNAVSEPYQSNTEIFGKTAAWVAILILIYAFVKRQVKP